MALTNAVLRESYHESCKAAKKWKAIASKLTAEIKNMQMLFDLTSKKHERLRQVILKKTNVIVKKNEQCQKLNDEILKLKNEVKEFKMLFDEPAAPVTPSKPPTKRKRDATPSKSKPISRVRNNRSSKTKKK